MTGVIGSPEAGLPNGPGLDLARLEPGFAEPVAAAQNCFRAILDAMARPGQIVRMPSLLAGSPPAPLGVAAAGVMLTLCDADTPVWFDDQSAPAADYLTYHCGAPLAAGAGQARFAFIGDPARLPRLECFDLGTDEYPERSATLVIEVAGLANDGPVVLSGPGIRDQLCLAVSGLPERFWAERRELDELFPRGLDVVFTAGDRIAALPRSTRIALL